MRFFSLEAIIGLVGDAAITSQTIVSHGSFDCTVVMPAFAGCPLSPDGNATGRKHGSTTGNIERF